jgi:hypothetical protein
MEGGMEWEVRSLVDGAFLLTLSWPADRPWPVGSFTPGAGSAHGGPEPKAVLPRR